MSGCTLHWNGKDLPEELLALPVGMYVIESVDQPPPLSDAEEAGLNAALDSLQAGKARSLAQVRETIAATLVSSDNPKRSSDAE